MTKEELFAIAKEDVFGPQPSCKKAIIGYNMAVSYFGPILIDAESVLLDMRKPHDGLAKSIENAFQFSQEKVIQSFPDETKKVISRCTRNFRTRYEPLLKEIGTKAA